MEIKDPMKQLSLRIFILDLMKSRKALQDKECK